MGSVSDPWGRLFHEIEPACVSTGACLIQEIHYLSLPVPVVCMVFLMTILVSFEQEHDGAFPANQ